MNRASIPPQVRNEARQIWCGKLTHDNVDPIDRRTGRWLLNAGLRHLIVRHQAVANKASIALVLEDEPLIAMDLEQTLGTAGFNVTTIMSCAEAEDWLRKFRPDLVIVDIELRDGRCDKIVERLIENQIPFIVHSGDHRNSHLGTPFVQGYWLGKPSAPDELIDAARDLIRLG